MVGRNDCSARKTRWACSMLQHWFCVGCCANDMKLLDLKFSVLVCIDHLAAEVWFSPFIRSYCYAALQRKWRIYICLVHEDSVFWCNSCTEINRPPLSLSEDDVLYHDADHSQWLRGLRNRASSLGRWDHGFESRLKHACLSSSIRYNQ
jgi:hypothetical protein